MFSKRTLAPLLVVFLAAGLFGDSQPESNPDALRCELQLGSADTLGTAPWSHFHFILLSDKDGLQVFKESNMWGYFAESFVLTDSGGTVHKVTRRERVWDSNWPAPVSIDKGNVLVRDVYLCDGSWQVLPKLPSEELSVQVVGRYTQQLTETEPPKALRSVPIDNVWRGSIKSSPVELYLSKSCVLRLNSSKKLW